MSTLEDVVPHQTIHHPLISFYFFIFIFLSVSYHVGDLVNVTCYSRGSSPPAELAWKVNDDKVSAIDHRGDLLNLDLLSDL